MKAVALLLVIGSSLLFSCECPIISCCGDVNIYLSLWVHDKDGRSMLDPGTEGYFNPDSIRLYSLKDGKLTLDTYLDELHYRHDRKIDTVRSGGKLHGGLSASLDNSGHFPQTSTTVIMWSENDSDTIDFEVIDKCDSQILLNKVWLNGQPQPFSLSDRLLDVTK